MKRGPDNIVIKHHILYLDGSHLKKSFGMKPAVSKPEVKCKGKVDPVLN
jgi:hypothetical protein